MAIRENGNLVDSDPVVLGLSALVWTLEDSARASRLLALTGLDPADLRASAMEPAMLAALLRFLEGHEPDLVACAESLEIAPSALVRARLFLEERSA